MNLQIRGYTAADRAACIAIFESNIPGSFTEPERPQFKMYLDALPGPYFVVTDASNVPVACGGYAVAPGTTCADLCWGMVVSDRHGQGIGRFLTQSRLGRIKADRRITEVALRTSHLTRAFYERIGFVVETTVPNGVAPDQDLCIMRLQLYRGEPWQPLL